ncbi:glycosyltransferase [Synechococcus sp. PCC 7336]|uniref:glycosyltransferase n=1 Tax=Synechococcus sp. PCC 7336 TaxID=195250 RepID=UPI00034C91ED|nr:glycosyltransferase [Synechococcus sp. PCC 7336]
MRLAYLTGEYPRATDTFIQREVETLRELGAEVLTCSVRPTGSEHWVGPEQRAERERTFYILPGNPLELAIAHLQLAIANPRRYWQALRLAIAICPPGLRGVLYQLFYFAEAGLLARHLQREAVRHLHNHFADSSCTVAMLAAELAGIRFSFTLHGPYVFFEPHRWRIDIKIAKSLFVCCISHFCRSQAMLFSTPDCWDKLHVVHCGVDPSEFRPADRDRLGRHLLYVGRLDAAKGLPVLFDSLAALKERHPDLLLTVVGDGGDRPQLEARVRQLGIREQVRFVGYKSRLEVRQCLQESDLLVLPSFAEGVPVVLMEAMAAGLPVVATRIAGISELVDDGESGYLVPPGDALALGNRISTLLGDDRLRSRLGAAGRAKVAAEFDIAREVAWLYRVMGSRLAGQAEPLRPEGDRQVEVLQPLGRGV